MRTIHFLALAMLAIGSSPARASLEPRQADRLAQQLREAHFARIGIESKTLVLVKPRVVPGGVEFEGVQGHPARPAIVVSADWDSISLPPHPVPWDRIHRIEAGTRSRRPGILIGASLGVITGVFWGLNGESIKPSLELGALMGVAGAGVGALFPTTKWKQLYPALVPANLDPVLTDGLEHLRGADYARIGIDERTYMLIDPQLGADGLGYEHVLKDGQKSLVPPPNPIPWSRMDHVEAGHRSRQKSALIGGFIGLLTGVGAGTAMAVAWGSSGDVSVTGKEVAVLGMMFSAVGAGIGALTPSTKWKRVYPQPER